MPAGNTAGVDIAYITNGYVYHTKYDDLLHIPEGSIQRAGDNVLSLVHALANTSVMIDHTEEEKFGSVIFFDVLGLFMVTYTSQIGKIINTLVGICGALSIILKFRKGNHQSLSPGLLLKGVVCTLVVMVIAGMTVLTMAQFLSIIDKKMSWFANPFLLVGLYWLPGVLAMICSHDYLKFTTFKNISQSSLDALFFDVTLVLWLVILLVLGIKQSDSAFYAMMWVASPLLGRNILLNFTSSFVTPLLAAVSFPLLMSIYILWVTFETFIPIMGRSGSEINPEYFVGTIVFISVLVCTSYLVGYIYKRPFFMCIRDRDALGVKDLAEYIPELESAKLAVCEKNLPYCGYPFYFSVRPMLRKNFLLPAKHSDVDHVKLDLVSRTKLGSLQNLTFTFTGSEHMTVFISPKPGCKVLKWSLTPEVPPLTGDGDGGSVYFIYYGGGWDIESWTMWLQVQTPEGLSNGSEVFDIAVSAYYVHGKKTTPEMKSFSSQQPDWVFTVPIVSTYDLWTF
ncbi:endoplasmic reticulum metallopeptidase 1-like [Anneissia japonica]|uniref:endoplasmic reticulum metallopeptidase 1-like n=1 Tax=Anneissia japonica TaxID=1529436 RepID=UPI0014257C33|nr:endoplasmic reticulum metallopeptidase 1-like [Anneissia japonica]